MIRHSKILLIIIFSLASVIAIAQENANIIITKRLLSVEDGMAARDVNCAVQDKDGFMWFGTSNGLNRYDGKSFKLYNTANIGLSSNSIYQLAIDDQNNLIIFYNCPEPLIKTEINHRIQVLDLKTYELKSFAKLYPHTPFEKNKVYWITNDETNDLNILTYGSVTWWKYNSKKGFVKQYEFKEPQEFNDLMPNIYSSYGNKSVFRKNYAAIAFPNHKVFFVSKDTAVLFHNTSALNKNGFIQWHLDLFYKYFFGVITAKEPSLSQKWTIHSAKEDINQLDYSERMCVNGAYSLLYKEKEGIFLRKDGRVLQLYTVNELKDFFELSISKNYVDKLGHLWICTSVGVLEVTLKKNHFIPYFQHSDKFLVKTNQTRGLYVEEGEKGETTVYANVYTGLVVQNQKKVELKTDIRLMCYALLHQKEGFYIGAYHLVKYAPNSGNVLKIDSVLYGETWSLYRFSEHFLLAGLTTSIRSYDLNSGKSVELSYISNQIPKVKNVYKIFSSATKGLIAVAENGVYCIDDQLRIVDYYGKNATDKRHQLPIETIYDLVEDKLGICWIASGGEGLFKWKWNEAIDAKSTIKHFTMIDGIPSLILYRIEQDEQDNLWIGTYNGLLRFDPNQNSSIVYTMKDGLTANEFNRISSFKAKSGELYFGSMNGVNAFSPKELNREIDSVDIPFRLINVSKFSAVSNHLIDCLKEYDSSHTLILEVGDKFLSIDFTLLDYEQRIHHYAYKIEGFEKEWIYLEDGSLRISGLPAGDYHVKIKAQLANGQWNKNEIILPITVLKPFYLHDWFIVSSILASILLIVSFYYIKMKQAQREKRVLENKVSERTQELQKSLKENQLLLTEIHHRVKNNLQVIAGLLELQGATIQDKNIQIVFKEGQSRVYSIALIHENLYSNDNIGIVYFHLFIRTLVSRVSALFEYTHQSIQFSLCDNEIPLDIDTAVPLSLILNELITNAYKYLPKNVDTNRVSIKLTEENGAYTLIYRDNGPGMKADFTLDSANTLGMQLIQDLAEQLGGNVGYSYQQGSCFTLYFNKISII